MVRRRDVKHHMPEQEKRGFANESSRRWSYEDRLLRAQWRGRARKDAVVTKVTSVDAAKQPRQERMSRACKVVGGAQGCVLTGRCCAPRHGWATIFGDSLPINLIERQSPHHKSV